MPRASTEYRAPLTAGTGSCAAGETDGERERDAVRLPPGGRGRSGSQLPGSGSGTRPRSRLRLALAGEAEAGLPLERAGDRHDVGFAEAEGEGGAEEFGGAPEER